MGKIYCTQCGEELDDSASFCSKCGESLNDTTAIEPRKNIIPNKKLIFVAIGVVIVLFMGIILIGSMGTGIPLEHSDFGIFEIDIPEGSNFEIYSSFSSAIIYDNNGKYSEEISGLSVHSKYHDPNVASELVEESDNMKVYQLAKGLREKSDDNFYEVLYEQDGLYFDLSGENLDLLKQMANTIVVKNY